ncbi:hypothetical protein MRQ36_32390 [Micromonospora sp. R77]|uniref:hypothetical protein n=1 Tax=Micromonospora sp. R77 TaxID=2925836 RepID=UPI001F612A38|nr:hypothetical protein [Micromonospora sp. R77]MCI4067014.1 hypothetical protein [Micromonospora sp. R77]
MTTMLMVLAVLAVVFAAVFGHLAYRDRRRIGPDEDRAAVRDARAARHRDTAQWQHPESDGIRRPHLGGGG